MEGTFVATWIISVLALYLSSAVSNSKLLEVPMTADHSAEEVNTTELPATEAVQEPQQSTRVRRPPDRFGFSYY